MGGKITLFRAVIVFVMIMAAGLVFSGVPWILAGIPAAILVLVAWVVKTAFTENTGDPEKNLFELGVRHTGAVKGQPLTGSEERVKLGAALELEWNGTSFRLGIASVESGAAFPSGSGRAVFLESALRSAVGLEGRIGRATWLRFLDRFGGSNCPYATVIALDAAGEPVFVSGKDRELLADLLRQNETLREKVAGLIRIGYDELHFQGGAINLAKSYERGDTSLERLESVLGLVADAAWLIDTEETARRVLAPPPEAPWERASGLFIKLIVVVAIGTGMGMVFIGKTPSDLLLVSAAGGGIATVIIVLRIFGLIK